MNLLFAFLLMFSPVKERFFPASFSDIQYMGRIDFSHPDTPRFWSPGVVVRWRFRGEGCRVIVRDQELYGKDHNYVEIVVEGRAPIRIKLKEREDTLLIDGGSAGDHVVSLCKDTEAGIGWLEMVGVIAEELLPLLPSPSAGSNVSGTRSRRVREWIYRRFPAARASGTISTMRG